MIRKNRPADVAPKATEAILESISDGMFTVDHEWRITSFNRAAEEITGVPRGEAGGRRCSEVFRAGMCEADCALRRTLGDGRPVVSQTGFIVKAEGRPIPTASLRPCCALATARSAAA